MFRLRISGVIWLAALATAVLGGSKEKPQPSHQILNHNSTSEAELSRNDATSTLTNSDAPLCTIRFRPEGNFQYFPAEEVQPDVFAVPFDAGEPLDNLRSKFPVSSPGDSYLKEIFRPIGRIPPYVRIECVSTYATKFKFEGVSALQFLRVWQRREFPATVTHTREDEGSSIFVTPRVLHRLGVEVLLAQNATGQYIIYPADERPDSPDPPAPAPAVESPPEVTDTSDPASATRNVRRSSFYIFAEGPAPHLVGRGRVVSGFANDTTVIVPCISSKYEQAVKLLWKNDRTGMYQFTAISNHNVHGIEYVRTVGFIINRRELRQTTKYPLVPGEYRCVGHSMSDIVDVVVTESPPMAMGQEALKLHVERYGSSVRALCTGPPGSNVTLSKFSANHLEGAALSKCLKDIGTSCGSSFHARVEGYSVSQYSVLTGLGSSGSLICASDTGDVGYLYYFTGLDGKIYTQPWHEIPIDNQLHLRIQPAYESSDGMLIGGKLAHIYCDVVGDINQPRFVYVTFANGTRRYVGSVDDDTPALNVRLHSQMKEVTCDAGPWDYSGSMYTTKIVDVVHMDCATPDEFQCTNEECVPKKAICFVGSAPKCSDGSSASFNCSAYYPYGCPASSADDSSYWQCKSGRCIYESYRCDGDSDCRDKDDENAESCERDFSPKILDGTREFTVLKYQEQNIVCEVSYQRVGDKPVIEWYLIHDDEESGTRRRRPVSPQKNTRTATTGTGVKSENEGFDVISVLHLANISESNVYECAATNRFGTASTSYRILVFDPIPPTTTTEEPPRPQHPVSHRFRCESEGKHPDPNNCQRYHECVEGASGRFRHFEFTCAEGTVYCEGSQTCGYEYDCPCQGGRRY